MTPEPVDPPNWTNFVPEWFGPPPPPGPALIPAELRPHLTPDQVTQVAVVQLDLKLKMLEAQVEAVKQIRRIVEPKAAKQ